jgi:predicted AlkP superfamily pyrophosphatase or phosphodiesterase
MRYFGVIFLTLFVTGVATANTAQPNSEQTVVLISIDGFRHDYIELHGAPNIEKIAQQGIRAEGLIPVYPSKTFPNHLSIVTGQYPSSHGIVDNNFYDTERKQHYRMGDGVKDSTWLTTLPIWNLAEFQGVKAATFFWPESEARINGGAASFGHWLFFGGGHHRASLWARSTASR